MKKLNNKGYFTSTSVIIVMLATLSLLAVFYSSIQARNIQIKDSQDPVVQVVNDRKVHARLYGVFRQDFYRTEDIEFSDLGATYKIYDVQSLGNKRTIELVEVNSHEQESIPTKIRIQIKQFINLEQPIYSKFEFEILS